MPVYPDVGEFQDNFLFVTTVGTVSTFCGNDVSRLLTFLEAPYCQENNVSKAAKSA
jgi:hypothetical protein